MKHLEILWRFLTLGCLSFGGPAAHVGYFRKAFVDDRGWLDGASYANLLALCQFLPGPASSQLGFAIGHRRGGLLGGLCAFIGFTLPSFLIMVLLATSTGSESTPDWFQGMVTGLKWLAVVVVADAILSMFSGFCQGKVTRALCVATAAILLITPGLMAQFGALILAATLGAAFLQNTSGDSKTAKKARVKWLPLVLFGLLFTLTFTTVLGIFGDFYQTGSLVFGGGHVVLPLLQSTVQDSVSSDRFLLGYAAAQAIPGPMFTLASFIGAELSPNQAWLGALIATAGIFLPGFLLVLALGEAWQQLAKQPKLAGAVTGLNAAVVGLLIAAFYKPVFVSAIHTPSHFAIALIGFFALRGLKLPMLVIVAGFAVTGIALS